MSEPTTTSSGSERERAPAPAPGGGPELGGAPERSTLAATNRTAGGLEGAAIGRPVTSRHEFSEQFTLYSGSTQMACGLCGQPTWFGPRLTELIDVRKLIPACADCMIEAMAAGAKPAGLVNLGNPEVRRDG